jgi:hypothetical protein
MMQFKKWTSGVVVALFAGPGQPGCLGCGR